MKKIINIQKVVFTSLFMLVLVLSQVVIDIKPFNVVEKVEAVDTYKLPYTSGTTRTMTAGNHNDDNENHYSNSLSAYAFDFGMPVGTDVRASKGGTVYKMKEDSNAGGCSLSQDSNANYIVIDHGDNITSLYLHLKENSIPLNVGDTVTQGQVIGKSGQTGYSCGAHLHYQVQQKCSGRTCQSISSSFADPDVLAQNSNGIPTNGNSYESSNDGSDPCEPVGETWNIAFECELDSGDIELFAGDVIIHNGGILTIENNTELELNLNGYKLEVKDGGKLIVKNGSQISHLNLS